MNFKNVYKKMLVMGCVILIGGGTLAGCGTKEVSKTESNTDSPKPSDQKQEVVEDNTPYKLSIMAAGANDETDVQETRQRIYQDIRDYTNTDVEFIFYDDTMYKEKLPLVLASGDLPSIMVVDKTPDIANAISNDVFWEVGPYLNNYENLKYIHPVALENASYNGKLYSVPRARSVGRNGVGYRLDWLENLGMKEPKTIDEFYKMLVAFTYNDPDGNGKDDTFGMAVTSYQGPWDSMQIWFGVPNEWGEDESGNLIPAHMTNEYDEALNFFRKIYSEGLVNQDFASYDSSKWDEMLRGGQAGCAVDVVDRFRRNQNYFEKEGIPAKTQIVGGFEGEDGLKLLPTPGFMGMFVFSKDKIKDETELQKALYFMDKMSDAEMVNLIEWGYKDEFYYTDDQGVSIRYTAEEKPEAQLNAHKALNQISSYIISPENTEKRLQGLAPDAIKQLELDVQIENEKYVVNNPAASYVSQTMVDFGIELDAIIDTARIQYITGEIDEIGLKEAKERWLKSGGQKVIEEMNAIHQANK